MSDSTEQWTEERLLSLIRDGTSESLTMEFKAGAALRKGDREKRELSKDVSAMANSAGGTIVYGMRENGSLATQLDGIEPTDFTREWLEDVLTGNIQPRLGNMTITQVPLTQSLPALVAYVVEIPKSSTAHQAADNRYYKRFNFKAVPMEDFEVRDVMNRTKFPIIIPKFSSRRRKEEGTRDLWEVDVTLRNDGVVRAVDLKVIIKLPKKLFTRDLYNFWKAEQRIDSMPYEEIILSHKVNAFVLHPGDEWTITRDGGMRILCDPEKLSRKQLEDSATRLRWTLHADDAPPQMGEIAISSLLNI